jgi:DNA-binding NtrC family response regulator
VILDGEIGRDGRLRSWADAAAIRRAHPALPVLMFSADPDALAEERAGTSRRSREAGFVGVVSKPFMIEEFLATLQRAIEGPARDYRRSADPSRRDASVRNRMGEDGPLQRRHP